NVYDVGQGSVTLYIASGASKDFYYDEYGAMAYTVEMRAGGSGFDPPPSVILPNAMENWEGFKAVLRDLL
ncbi:MAG: M14 family zinc carboxypeptidase, partial [Fimbriimonadales bacterium]